MDVCLICRMCAITIMKAIQKNPALKPPKMIITLRLCLHSVQQRLSGSKVCQDEGFDYLMLEGDKEWEELRLSCLLEKFKPMALE